MTEFDPADLPAYGQVWKWKASPPFMLVRSVPDTDWGEWIVVFIYSEGVSVSEPRSPLAGLYDDPEKRLPEYKRIA